ncbi:spore coat protein [Neobacillus muris]|uniref:spore coat protein n=1 Tax=Neobacillus muris TaxID=2941334 RepID=UPI00203A4A02|nr:spore coat protein [Neobacillus muris]
MAGRKGNHSNQLNQSNPSIPLDAYHSFLKSLIGQDVQVYKGGPESKQGTLLDVQSDYICVLAQNNNNNNNNNQNNQNQNQNQQPTVVYYRTQHLQSISENSKSNSMPRYQNNSREPYEFYRAGSFDLLMEKFIEKYVQINLGGPESKTGMLLDTSGNYVALLTEDDGVVYYNVHHIKSISEYNNNNNENSSTQDSGQQVQIPEYYRADDFHDLFGQMSHKWVSINRGGPEAIEGVLVQGMGGHYTIVSNDEVLRINPYHIKSISSGPKGALKQNNNSQQNNSNEDVSKAQEESGEKNARSTSKSSRMESSRTSSSSSSSGGARYERVVKKIDYVWKPR